MTVAPGEAKVLVAKMPTIPPQLLGAQPSTGLTEAMQDDKLPGIISLQIFLRLVHNNPGTRTRTGTERMLK